MKKWMGVLLLLAMLLSMAGCGDNQTEIDGGLTCTLEVRCDNLLSNLENLEPGKAALVPEDGILLAETTVAFQEGESVFDVLRRTLRGEKIHFEYVDASAYNAVYIEGIGNLYEFDCGPQSGWMYSVNGVYPGLGCSDYKLSEGDKIVFCYTCDLGVDLGETYEK